jgi:non-ribosomal peptide synthase protein (TIGR01720 family)
LAFDMVSLTILLEDLQSVYEQLQRGGVVCLPQKTTSYKDWAGELAAYAKSNAALIEADYWRSLPWKQAASLPVDHVGTSGEPLDEEAVVSLDKADTAAILHRVQRRYGVQFDEVLLTCLADALGRWANSRIISLILMHHGRVPLANGIDLSRTVGWFSTEIPLLLDLSSATDLGESMQAVKEQVRQAPNSGIGYGILRYMNADHLLADLPAPQVRLNHLGRMNSTAGVSRFRPRTAGFGDRRRVGSLIEIRTYVDHGCLTAQWLFDGRIHDAKTIQHVADCFIRALQDITQLCAPVPSLID